MVDAFRAAPTVGACPHLSLYVPLACSILFCQVIDHRTSRSGRQRFSHFLRGCSWQPPWPPFTAFGECRMRSWYSPRRSSRHACQRERSTLKRRLPVGRNIIPGAGRRSTSERPLLSALSASSSRTACATSAGNISCIDLLSYKYHRPDRPSSCVLFATTKCASVEQAGTYSHLYSISAACLPPSTN